MIRLTDQLVEKLRDIRLSKDFSAVYQPSKSLFSRLVKELDGQWNPKLQTELAGIGCRIPGMYVSLVIKSPSTVKTYEALLEELKNYNMYLSTGSIVNDGSNYAYNPWMLGKKIDDLLKIGREVIILVELRYTKEWLNSNKRFFMNLDEAYHITRADRYDKIIKFSGLKPMLAENYNTTYYEPCIHMMTSLNNQFVKKEGDKYNVTIFDDNSKFVILKLNLKNCPAKLFVDPNEYIEGCYITFDRIDKRFIEEFYRN